MNARDFWEDAKRRHAEAVERGEHDASADEGFYICNCAKRAREATGFTEIPTQDLDFPPPSCPHCDRYLDHNGDGWDCSTCHLSWNSAGTASSAHFHDDHGDLSRCAGHGRRGCVVCTLPKVAP